MKIGGALAIFVKTPGISPVKTRLAAGLGVDRALRFYLQSVKATSAIAKELQNKLPGLQIYWAVAEKTAVNAEIWSDFPTLWQGEGGLGQRLSSIYNQILHRHDFACFLGADSPHLDVEAIESGILKAAVPLTNNFVIGETYDGGFYFFGGRKPLPADLWLNVEYSSEKTVNQLKTGLQNFGGLEFIEKNFDIDMVEDLQRYSEPNFLIKNILPAQSELIKWAKTLN